MLIEIIFHLDDGICFGYYSSNLALSLFKRCKRDSLSSVEKVFAWFNAFSTNILA